MKIYKSHIFRMVYKFMEDMYRHGYVDEETMQYYYQKCLTNQGKKYKKKLEAERVRQLSEEQDEAQGVH